MTTFISILQAASKTVRNFLVHILSGKGIISFSLPAKCKTLGTSRNFLDSASLCTNKRFRKEAG